MKTDLKEILESLPDFEDLEALALKIREASVKKLILEKDIKSAESGIVRTAITDTKYFTNDKPPAMSFVDAAYKYTGFNGELIPLREQYAQAVGDLDLLRMTMDIYKTMYETWRTLSANERGIQ